MCPELVDLMALSERLKCDSAAEFGEPRPIRQALKNIPLIKARRGQLIDIHNDRTDRQVTYTLPPASDLNGAKAIGSAIRRSNRNITPTYELRKLVYEVTQVNVVSIVPVESAVARVRPGMQFGCHIFPFRISDDKKGIYLLKINLSPDC
ncbi:hypothetical protein EMIT043CA1_80088 [Pseudomonas brassicacearum]